MTIFAPSAPVVNFDFAATLLATPDESDGSRPTAGPDYIPTPEEDAEAAELLNSDDEPTDAEWDAMAEDAMHLEMACTGHWAF